MGIDLRGSILLSSESFAPKFWEMIKLKFQCILVWKLKFDQNGLTWFMIWTAEMLIT